jgi:hypothetical protein
VQQLQKQQFDLKIRLETGIDMDAGRLHYYPAAPRSSTRGR